MLQEYDTAGRYFLAHGRPIPSQLLDQSTVNIATMVAAFTAMTSIAAEDVKAAVEMLVESQDESLADKAAKMPGWFLEAKTARFPGSMAALVVELIMSNGLEVLHKATTHLSII